MKNNLSDIILEKYLLGELPEKKHKEITLLLQNDTSLRSKLRNLEKSNVEFFEKYPSEFFMNSIEMKKSTGTNKTNNIAYYFRIFTLPALAAAAVLVFFVSRPMLNDTRTDIGENVLETTTLKGNDLSLSVFKKENGGPVQLFENSTVKQNDVLQLEYRTSGWKYGVIFSVDGRGSLTIHYPIEGKTLSELDQNKKIPLQNSYILDDAPYFERFFFVVSNEKTEISDITGKLLYDNKSNDYILNIENGPIKFYSVKLAK